MTSGTPAAAPGAVPEGAALLDTDTFVSRIPILDASRRVVAYELRFRSSSGAASALDQDMAAARVIGDAVLSVGLDALTGGQRAFVRVSRPMLMDGMPAVLPPKQAVLLLSADLEADDDVRRACQELRRAGFALALDDFNGREAARGLVPLAQYVKIDASAHDATARAAIVRAIGSGGPALIAAGVEQVETFDAARREGFTFFQGFFFGRPTLQEARAVPAQQVGSLRLLQALNAPDISVTDLEALIKRDASLAYRVLRTVNSAAFARRSTIESIRQALVLLGRDTIRRWASLWALSSLGGAAQSELVTMSTVRARCCELLAADADTAAQGFLVGMCSLLDAILECPLPTALADLPLPPAARAALDGADNPLRHLLDAVVAYESGDWTTAIETCQRLGMDPLRLRRAHADALRWAHDLKQADAGGAAA